MSFWGLTLESGKRYAQKVETAFHVSMAALDMKTADNSDVSVYVGVDNNDFLMCNLAKQRLPQQSLDLNFDAGEQIAFTTKGKGVVHLTGYLAPTDEFPFPEDEEESEEDEEAPMLIPAGKGDKKRKNESPKMKQDSKKTKLAPKQIAEPESDSEGSDDDSGDEMASGSDEEGMWEDADNSGDDSDDESDGDEEEEEEEEEVTLPTPISKKQQKQQQKQQQQQKTPNTPPNTTSNKTPNKTPMLNGSTNQKESGKKKNKEEKGQTPKSAKKENQQSPGKNAQTPGKSPKTPQESPVKKVLAGGVIVEDLTVGAGPVAKSGRSVSVYYAGRLKSNNKMFDSSQSGAGFRFRLGQSEVIKGWDVGVQGMKVGGKRRIICPPHMAYGQKGSPPAIPPNSFLVFDVELKTVS